MVSMMLLLFLLKEMIAEFIFGTKTKMMYIYCINIRNKEKLLNQENNIIKITKKYSKNYQEINIENYLMKK